MIPYEVRKIEAREAKAYICQNHYSRGIHNGPSPCYGLYDSSGKLLGVLAFATPCSEAVRASIFGPDHKDAVIELHRLHILDCTPKNTESWMISRCLRLLRKDKPRIRCVVSFADPTEGHIGTIYKASNFIRDGKSSKARFYRDQNGRLRHPRQNGKNISLQEARSFGWEPCMREGKIRYLYFLYNKDRKQYIKEKSK